MNTLPLRTIPVISLWLPVRNLTKPVLTFEMIAEECGVSSAYVSMWFSGTRNPNEKHAAVLARLLRCDLDMIWMKAMTPEEVVDIVKEKVDATTLLSLVKPDYTLAEQAGLEIFEDVKETPGRVRLGVYPVSLAASPPDQLDPIDEQGEVWLEPHQTKRYGAKLHAVRVSGPSMNQAGIDSGDVLLVRRSTRAKDGSIVIASEGGGVTIKRLRGNQLVSESDRMVNVINLTDNGDDGGGNKLLGVVIGIHKPTK